MTFDLGSIYIGIKFYTYQSNTFCNGEGKRSEETYMSTSLATTFESRVKHPKSPQLEPLICTYPWFWFPSSLLVTMLKTLWWNQHVVGGYNLWISNPHRASVVDYPKTIGRKLVPSTGMHNDFLVKVTWIQPMKDM